MRVAGFFRRRGESGRRCRRAGAADGDRPSGRTPSHSSLLSPRSSACTDAARRLARGRSCAPGLCPACTVEPARRADAPASAPARAPATAAGSSARASLVVGSYARRPARRTRARADPAAGVGAQARRRRVHEASPARFRFRIPGRPPALSHAARPAQWRARWVLIGAMERSSGSGDVPERWGGRWGPPGPGITAFFRTRRRAAAASIGVRASAGRVVRGWTAALRLLVAARPTRRRCCD